MKWETQHCTDKFYYICKKKQKEEAILKYPEPYPTIGNCSHSQEEFENLCYEYFENSQNYTEANTGECLLPSINSEEVQGKLKFFPIQNLNSFYCESSVLKQ